MSRTSRASNSSPRHVSREQQRRKSSRNSHLVRWGLLLAPLLSATAKVQAFSGEDPVFGYPWYHEKLTRLAAKQAGFSANAAKDAKFEKEGDGKFKVGEAFRADPLRNQDGAAEAVAWHADYIDSYLYNPLWWAKGGLDRYKVSKAMEAELEKCHFDDLFSSDKVNSMWRRYASGAFAGLMWAKERDDVYAAQNIIGVSLHAMQDFYAHSSWVDKKERRTKTYFEYSRAARLADNLYTGAYEHDHQTGVKSHGKWIPEHTVWAQPGVKQVMEVACDPLSPFSNSESCAAYKAVKAGTPMTPKVGNIRLPDSIMVYTPAGIALDNTWVADESIRQRGIAGDFTTDSNSTAGKKAFDLSYELALRQSVQWLQTLERAMTTAGARTFWQKVKTTPASDQQRFAQYENYSQFPFTFMSAGDYPPSTTARAEEWFLRVRLQTATGRTGDTNADIKLRAGGKVFDLDYLPKTIPGLAYDDFEAGDNDVYVVGPFASLPDSFDLINDAGDGRELLESFGRDFVFGVEKTWEGLSGIVQGIVGTRADKVAVNKKLWTPQDLAAVPSSGQAFSIELNGGKEGNYRTDGTIFKVGEDELHYEFAVRLDRINCIKESTWDRGSSSDEPFQLCVLNPFPGEQQESLTTVFPEVDSGESRDIGQQFERVRIAKNSGMLNLAITQMESDDESPEDRKKLLQAFAGKLEENIKEPRRHFLEALSTSIGAQWKIAHMEVGAWSRNGQIRQGQVLNAPVNRWVRPKTFETFQLNVNAARDTGISTDDLLPELSESGQPTHDSSPVPVPTPPSSETSTPSPTEFDLTTWVDEWDTTYGRVKLELTSGVLRGRLYIAGEWGGEKESDLLELRAGNAPSKITGTASYTGSASQVVLTLSPNGNSFTASSISPNGLTSHWSGKRLRRTPGTGIPGTGTAPSVPTPSVPTTPTTPSTPNVPTVPSAPTAPAPTVPTLPTTPTTPIPTVPTAPSTGNSGGFRTLGEWGVQIESMRVARDSQVEVVAVYKNLLRKERLLDASILDLVLTDSDGLGIRNIGNLYKPDGDPDIEPEKIVGSVPVGAGATTRVLGLFTIPPGATPLKTLSVFGRLVKPLTFNVSGLTLPEPVAAVTIPPRGASGGTGSFEDFGVYGLRFDGVRRGRNNSLQIFVTVKSMEKLAWRSHPTYSLDVSVVDANGATIKDDNNLYRASGEGLELQRIQHGVFIVPGGETTLCYVVNLPPGAKAKQLQIKFEGKMLSANLPDLP